MKIFVKTLKGTNFEIEVKPSDTVDDVKKNIENVQGQSVYPAAQQMLIHQGKVLKDSTTLEENTVAENSFIVVMLGKNKVSSTGASTASAVAETKAPAASSASLTAIQPSNASQAPVAAATTLPEATVAPPVSSTADVYSQAASNLAAGSNLDTIIQQILDMGGGSWDRETVIRALRAAFNNPERAVEYLYSGIPEQADAPQVARAPASGQPMNPPTPTQAQQQAVPTTTSGPNANPLDLFPQGLPTAGGTNAGAGGTLDFLRNSQQFQALRSMVQANPQILQELGRQNPNLMRLIQDHQADFLRLINEPVEGEGDVLGDLASSMPQSVTVTPEERAAIERLEAMGFDHATVLEVFFACNKNEELAANYLLDHSNDFED